MVFGDKKFRSVFITWKKVFWFEKVLDLFLWTTKNGFLVCKRSDLFYDKEKKFLITEKSDMFLSVLKEWKRFFTKRVSLINLCYMN